MCINIFVICVLIRIVKGENRIHALFQFSICLDVYLKVASVALEGGVNLGKVEWKTSFAQGLFGKLSLCLLSLSLLLHNFALGLLSFSLFLETLLLFFKSFALGLGCQLCFYPCFLFESVALHLGSCCQVGFHELILLQEPLFVFRLADLLIFDIKYNLGHQCRVVAPLLLTEAFNLFVLTEDFVQQELSEPSPARVETGLTVLAVIVVVVTSLIDECLYLVLGASHMLFVLKVKDISEIAFQVDTLGLGEAFVE